MPMKFDPATGRLKMPSLTLPQAGGGVVPEVLRRFIGPTTVGDGSAVDKPISMYGLNTMIQQIAAQNRPGLIDILTDRGNYAWGGGSPVEITAGNPGAAGHPILIRSVDSNGNPGRAVVIGNRPAPPSTSISGPIIFNLRTGANNLTFRGFDVRNVKNFAAIDAADADNLRFEDLVASGFYRLISNDWSPNANNQGVSRVRNLVLDGIQAEHMAQAMLVTRNSRGVLVQNFSVDGKGVNQLSNDPAVIILSPSFGSTVGMQDFPDDVVIRNGFATNIFMAGSGQFIQGDLLNADDAANEFAMHNMLVENVWAELVGDGGFDTKAESGTYRGIYGLGCAFTVKCWARPGFTPRFEAWGSLNPSQVVGSEAGSAKGRQHFYGIFSNVTFELGVPEIYDHIDGLLMPPTRLPHPRRPVGSAIPASGSSCIIRSAESATGQAYNVDDWELINVRVGIEFYLKDGTGSTTAGATITFRRPLPVVSMTSSAKAGFEGRFVPQETPVGTVFEGTTFTHDQGAAYTGVFSIGNDPDGKFEMLPNGDVRLKAPLDATVKTTHDLTTRAVFGKVGTDHAFRNANDFRTWRTHLGFKLGGAPAAYRESASPIIVMGDDIAEVTAWLNSAQSAGLDMSGVTRPWRTLWSAHVKAMKDAGIWDLASIPPPCVAPTGVLANRSFKGNHHGTAIGGVTKTPRGPWEGNGIDGYVEWSSFAPNADPNWQQDSAGLCVQVFAEQTTGHVAFAMGSGTSLTTLLPRVSSGQQRINAQNATNTTALTTSLGIFTLNRTGATAHTLRQSMANKGTGSVASVAPTAGHGPRLLAGNGAPPTLFSPNKALLWYLGAALNTTQEQALNNLIAATMATAARVP